MKREKKREIKNVYAIRHKYIIPLGEYNVKNTRQQNELFYRHLRV